MRGLLSREEITSQADYRRFCMGAALVEISFCSGSVGNGESVPPLRQWRERMKKHRWSEKTEIGVGRFIPWLDITASKFYDWRESYGKGKENNGWGSPQFL